MDDLIIGAFKDDPNGSNSGAAFVVYGMLEQGSSVTLGTTGNDVMNGTVGADQLVGGAGNDALTANNSNDILNGGSGDDIFTIDANNQFNLIDGGNGSDTLSLGSAMSLDLSLIPNNRLQNLENIDLSSDGGNSTLVLNDDDILTLPGSEGSNTLQVTGDSGDSVDLTNSSFTDSGNPR